MAELIVTAPKTPGGLVAIEHLSSQSGQRNLGIGYLQSLEARIAGSTGGTGLGELRHSFHLIEASDGDEIGAINRILQWHNGEREPRSVHGSIDSVEINLRFPPSASMGLPFTLGGFHEEYLRAMNVENAHQASVLGSGIRVAVVDSGASAGMRKPVDDFYDVESRNPLHPVTRIDNDGHGTAMATLVQEVAPEAKVIAVRVYNQSTINLWNLLAGTGVAAFDCNADIISLSLGYVKMPGNCRACGASIQSRSLAFQYLLDGISESGLRRGTPPIYVAATGNDSSSESFNYPAAYDSAVAIGSVTSHLTRSSFSNYGKTRPKYFLMAPGGQEDPPKEPTEDVGCGGSTRCRGTSVSTAYAAGMLALLWSDARYQRQSRDVFLSNVQREHCVPLPQGNPDPNQYGSGMLRYHEPTWTEEGQKINLTARVERRDGKIYVGGMRIWPPLRFKKPEDD